MRAAIPLFLAACAAETSTSTQPVTTPDLPQQGSFICDLVIGPELPPWQAPIDIERDRILMSHPGMRQKMLPIARLESRTVRDCTAARLRERFGLTAAEMRVLRLVALGLTNATIADRCDVSVETVRTHVARVLAKLDVGMRAQAAALVWSYETE